MLFRFLLVGVGGVVDEMTVGLHGQVLTVIDNPNSGESDFVQWATPATDSGAGNVSDGQNLIGSSAGVFSSKSGTFLQFRRISSGSSNDVVTENLNDITITVADRKSTRLNSSH